MKSHKDLVLSLVDLPPYQRRFILIIIDIIIIFLTFILAFFFQDNNVLLGDNSSVIFELIYFNLIILLFYFFTGYYKGLTKYNTEKLFYETLRRNGIATFFFYLVNLVLQLDKPIKNYLLIWVCLTFLGFLSRILMRDILLNINFNTNKQKNRVIIYGAGSAGAQLEAALRYSQKYKVCLFFDDDKNLHNRFLNGKRITSSIEISKYKNQIDTVLLAIPSVSIKRRFEILKFLQRYGVGILQIPSLEDIASGAENIDSLKPIDIEELLGRNVAEIGNQKEDYNLNGETVCVTGAGGSIGGELCRQIFLKNPSKLVLIENSEVNLYQIIKELENLSNIEIELIPILGSACDKELIEEIFEKYKISVVFHAAAYKHVPLVEINPIQGLENNIFSTKILCETSLKNNCKKFILISTDKAVRPTNIMGVSKRLSEIIVQCFAELSCLEKYKNKTCFSMVRFGNVLGSSGSVVPLFKEQLNKGGPITLTHPDIIRYFMTIKESVHLVLQASVLAEGGEVFLLDMGEPVRIFDLAIQMIKLSGLTLKDSKKVNGDIEIKVTGLRPGEKLYEELLVDGNSLKTSNPQIFKAREKYIPLNTFLPNIQILRELIQERDTKKIYSFLKKLMPEFNLKNY